MFLAPSIWLQSHPLSKTVIVFASLLFILAIALLVYFVRKLRASSKTEEDWSLTRSSLFVEPPAEKPAAESSVADATQVVEEPAPEPEALGGGTRLLASETPVADLSAPEVPPSAPPERSQTLEIAA